jgi:hypothetical protein
MRLIKAFLLLLLLLTGAVAAYAQYTNNDAKRDHTWILGFGDQNQQYYQSMKLDFNQDPFTTTLFPCQINLGWANACISDTNGQLLFFTNGLFVCDRNGNIMPHGDSLNYGYYYTTSLAVGYPLANDVLILPMPLHKTRYYILHEKWIDHSNYIGSFMYSLIDMNENNGMGDVLFKNQLIVSDTLSRGGFSVVRHANGRDWWIYAPKAKSTFIYRYLLNPEGLTFDGMQDIGFTFSSHECFTCFSPDGSKFAIQTELESNYGSMDSLFEAQAAIFDVNRANGWLSGIRNISYLDIYHQVLGIRFSPNSRFLYGTHGLSVYQWDTESPDIAATKTTVATWDGFYWYQCKTGFMLPELGPDGKIYFVAGGSSPYLHVINNPDEAGIACNVLQHSITLPYPAWGGLPYSPNFRLGAAVGIEETAVIKTHAITAFPNPATAHIQFSVDITNNHNPMQFEIINTLGQTIRSEYFAPFQNLIRFDVTALQPGVYLAILHENSVVRGRVKFVVD